MLVEPLPTLPGFPFLIAGAGALIVGPTGGGRSSLVQACAYDAARAGVRVAYLGHEITAAEFDVRAAKLAGLRGHELDDALRADLARVRYLDLISTVARAWEEPAAWVAGMVAAFDVALIDPLSAVESALGLDFERRNTDLVRFWDALVQPITAKGVSVVLVENVGHAIEAKSRAKGASAKSDRADLTFACALVASPPGLVIRTQKVRSVRAGFRRGDEWTFARDTQTIERQTTAANDDGDGFRPTHLMEKVSRFVEADPGVTVNAIKQGVSGKREYIAAAIEVLIAEGFIERHQRGQAQQHRPIRPFREDDESALEPSPDDRDPVGAESAGQTSLTEPRESSTNTRPGTGSEPSPDRVPASVQTTEAPMAHVRSTGPRRASVDELDADAELERLESKYGPDGI